MIGTFLLTLTQLEKNISMVKFFIPMENQNPVSKLEVDHVFRDRYKNILALRGEFAFLLTREMN